MPILFPFLMPITKVTVVFLRKHAARRLLPSRISVFQESDALRVSWVRPNYRSSFLPNQDFARGTAHSEQ
jgi:hypothetical protein